eukprot:1145477-Pelagomonas_calceolata.AAC.3
MANCTHSKNGKSATCYENLKHQYGPYDKEAVYAVCGCVYACGFFCILSFSPLANPSSHSLIVMLCYDLDEHIIVMPNPVLPCGTLSAMETVCRACLRAAHRLVEHKAAGRGGGKTSHI